MVDDERAIADTLTAILNQQGYDASAVYSGTEAVEVARQLRPDLIISDVVMPDMDGIESAILIRAFLPDCKILLISGNAATRDLMGVAHRKGYDFDLLCKPIHPTDLLANLGGGEILTTTAVVQEHFCKHCGSPMHPTPFGYSYCASLACNHREWDDPRQSCLCQACEAEKKKGRATATST